VRRVIVHAALAVVLAVGLVAIGLATFRHSDPPKPSYVLTAADRAPLVDAGARLRHPTFGFSFVKPPSGFKESSKLVEYVERKLDNAGLVYGYTDPDNRASFMVIVLPASGNDEDAIGRSLDAFFQGMTSGDQGATERERTLGPNTGRVDIHLRGGQLRAEVHAIRAGSGWVHVLLAVGSPRQNYLGDVLASFQP
jgi:hypothetical protein